MQRHGQWLKPSLNSRVELVDIVLPHLAASGVRPARAAHSAALVVIHKVGLNLLTSGTYSSAVKSTRTSTTTSFEIYREREVVLVSASVAGATRRSGKELSVHNQA
jgi:hypothetical protein